MNKTMKKTVTVLLSLGLTTAGNAYAFGHGHFGGGHQFRANHVSGGNFRANHSGHLNHNFNNQATFANNQFNTQHSFHNKNNNFVQNQQTLTVNKNSKTFHTSESTFIHATPSFNNVHKNTVVKANTVTHVNKSITHNMSIVHTGNVVTKKSIVTTHATTPVVVNHNQVIVNRHPGVTPVVVRQPVVIAPNPNYWHNHYYGYNYWNDNDVNDALAVALGISLVANVAQFAAAENHNNTNTVVYPTTSSGYNANTMSVYQPIPYAPTSSSKKSTSSTSSQPVNVSVNTTVNTAAPTTSSPANSSTNAAADTAASTTATNASMTTASPLTTMAGDVNNTATDNTMVAAVPAVNAVN